MNKTELIETTAEDSGLAPEDAAKVIDSMLATVTSTLIRGEDVTNPGFGKFSTVQSSALLAPAATRLPAPSLRSKRRPHRSSPPALA